MRKPGDRVVVVDGAGNRFDGLVLFVRHEPRVSLLRVRWQTSTRQRVRWFAAGTEREIRHAGDALDGVVPEHHLEDPAP